VTIFGIVGAGNNYAACPAADSELCRMSLVEKKSGIYHYWG